MTHSRALCPAFVAWVSMIVSWLGERLTPEPPPMQIIPEPINNSFFFFTGAALSALVLLRGLARCALKRR